MDFPIDTANYEMVGLNGERLVIMRPKMVMTKEEAYSAAAWLFVMAEMIDQDLGYSWEQLIQAIRDS